MTHDEANAAQKRIFAVDDLAKAVRLVELCVGVFAPVDDKSLSEALQYIRRVLVYHKGRDTRPPPPAPLGDVAF